MSQNLYLKTATVENFGGIDSTKPIVLYFENDKNIAIVV